MSTTRLFACLLGVAVLVQVASFAPQAQASTPRDPHAVAASPGYWLVTGYGSTYAYDAPYLGTQFLETYQSPCENNGGYGPYPGPACVGIAASPSGAGYWVGESIDYGGALSVLVYPAGDANSCSQAPVGNNVNAPGVGIAAGPVGAWLAAADGGVFAYCGATYYGSMGGHPLNRPIVGMAATPDGKGYWLVASDGGVFAFGDAPYLGSMGGTPLEKPIVGMAATPDGKGYWLVATDGGVFAFGDAKYSGSMAGTALTSPMVGIAANPDGTGYWTVAADAGVFAFGDAPFIGSAAGSPLDAPIVGIAAKG